MNWFKATAQGAMNAEKKVENVAKGALALGRNAVVSTATAAEKVVGLKGGKKAAPKKKPAAKKGKGKGKGKPKK